MKVPNDILMHYASKYYDPVKAHEYYERTKELQGRRAASGLSEEGKKVWKSVREQISSEKKGAVDAASAEKKAKSEAARANAQAARQRISEKIKTLSENLTKKLSEDREDLNEKMEEELQKVPLVPDGLGPNARKRALEKRMKAIAEIENTYAAKKAEKAEASAAKKQSEQSSSASEKQAISQDLSASIGAAREAYAQAKVSIDSSYEDIYNAEYDKIKASMPKIAKKKGRKAKYG